MIPLVFLLAACGERVERPMDLNTYKEEMAMCLSNADNSDSYTVSQCRGYAEDVAVRAAGGRP